MASFRSFPRRSAVLALALFASLLSCGREVTGPGGRGSLVSLSFAPSYASMIEEVDGVAYSVAGLVPFTKVRIELRRVDNTIAAAEVVDFPAEATEIPLSINVRLGDAAKDGAEPLTAFLRYINAAGDTVFAGGPVAVIAKAGRAGQEPQPVQIEILPTVPGADFARLEIAPDTIIANSGTTARFTATGFDAQDVVVPNAIIGFISRNPALVAVPNLGSGDVNLVGVRGTTWLVAQSLLGLKDSAFVQVLPVASTIVKVSGDAQSALTGAAFAQPLKVRVVAADGLGVADWPVTFAVVAGGGSLSASFAATDAEGYAEVLWTAGATPGPAGVTIAANGVSAPATFTGTQVSSAPTALAFLTQPANIVAGDAINGIEVAVRNGAGETVTEFTGEVTLGLTGTGGGALVGTMTTNAVAGVATFNEFTVNRGGTAYRLVATSAGLPPVESNPFDVAAPAPAILQLLSGSGQSAPPQTVLADSIRALVLDTFENPMPGITVTFTVTQGGGSVSVAQRVTDANGRAATAWTLGTEGTQQLVVAAGQLQQNVFATVVTAGQPTLFAGFDFTTIPSGQAKAIPIFLSAAAATTTSVALVSADPTIANWSVASVEILPGITQSVAQLQGGVAGSTWVFLNSPLGNDSLLVTVDTASVLIGDLFWDELVPGDTMYTLVRLTEPAPPGGVTVTVRSLDSLAVLVAPSSGAENPVPSCVDLQFCYAGLREATSPPAALLAPAAGTATLTIPAGQMSAALAIVGIGVGQGLAELTASAAGYRDGSEQVFPIIGTASIGWSAGSPSAGIGVGQTLSGEFYFNQPSFSSSRRLQLRIANPLAASVDSVAVASVGELRSAPIRLTALAEDTTYLVWEAPGYPADSVPIIVTAPRYTMSSSTTNLAQHAPGTLFISRGEEFSGNVPNAADVPFILRTEPAGIVALDRSEGSILAGDAFTSVGFVAIGVGTTNVIIDGQGGAPDTVAITTFAQSPSLVPQGSTLGVGLRTDIRVDVPFTHVLSGPKTFTVSSNNPAVAAVLTPSVTAASAQSAIARVAGLSVGAAQLSFSAPGYSTITYDLTVTATSLSLTVPTIGLDPEGFDRPAQSLLTAGGTAFAPLDTTRAVLRSSDSTVVAVTDSLVTWLPQSAFPSGGRYQLMRPGTATLWLVRPGVDSASSDVITVNPYRVILQGPLSMGQGMETPLTVFRTGPENVDAAITVTQQGPGLVSILGLPATFGSASQLTAQLVGEAVGLDTIIVSIPDHASDTLIVDVRAVRAELALASGIGVDWVDEFVSANFRPVVGSSFYTPGRVTTLRLRSTDSTKAVVLQDTLRFQAGAFEPDNYGVVAFKESGPVSLILDDVDGILARDSVEVFVEPRTLSGSSYYSDRTLILGQRQRTDDFEVFLDRGVYSPQPLTVTLTSTDTTIVQVPAFVQIGGLDRYVDFVVTSDTAVGSARIIASAPGYNPWEMDVFVTRGKVNTYVTDGAVGGRGYAESYVTDALVEYTHRTRDPIPLRMLSSDLMIADTVGGSFTFPADSAYFEHEGLLGVAAGEVQYGIEDTRIGNVARLTPGSQLTRIGRAKLQFGAERLAATPNTRISGSDQYLTAPIIRDSVWVRFTNVRARVNSVDSILVLRSQGSGTIGVPEAFEDFPLFGVSLGVDTLIVSADGYESDSVLVDVQNGIIAVQGLALPSILVGDSVQVTFLLRGPTGDLATVRSAINMSFSTDTSLVVTDGAVPITTRPIDLGDGFATVWIRGVNAGQHDLLVSAPNFAPLTVRLNVVTR